MKPKLYLHAGTHKTGTTAIQQFALAHRQQLKRRGLLYPNYSPFSAVLKGGHHVLAYSLLEDQRSSLSAEEAKVVPRYWRDLCEQEGLSALVSVEALYRLHEKDDNYWNGRRAYLSKLAECLEEFDVEVILVFRRPDDFIRSLYTEIVTKRPKKLDPFESWCFSPKRMVVEYYANACLFEEIFGKVSCFLYEDIVEGGSYVSEFFKSIGFDVSDLPATGIIRKSLSAKEVVVKNYANSCLRSENESRRFICWMRAPHVQKMIENELGPGRRGLWPNHETRKRFLDLRQSDLIKLNKRFFPNKPFLFPHLQESETCAPVGRVPDRLVEAIQGWQVVERF